MYIIPYKCRCMAEEAQVFVRDRGKDQDVVDWVERTVGKALAADHRSRSPLCRADKTDYIKIPLHRDDEEVGRRREGT